MDNTAGALYEFGPYRLDCPKRLLLRDGKSLTLAPKTFDLLLLLVESQGRVLTKKELMGALWPDTFVEEANLAFQISGLRKALGDEGAEWIETVPRHGYRFSGAVFQLRSPTSTPGELKAPNENGQTLDGEKSELSPVYQGPSIQLPRKTRRWTAALWPLATALATITALIFGVLYLRRSHPRERVVTFIVSPPDRVNIPDLDSISLSPDGERVGFIGVASDGKRQLWVRPLDSLTTQPIKGTELVNAAFWSPDSRAIGFFASGKLKRVDLHGGTPQTICETPAGRGTWNRDGVILFDGSHPEIYRVAATGGEPVPATALDGSNQETLHALPQFLPDSRHFIYFVQSARPENTGIYVASLDSKAGKRLVNSNTNALYATSASGGHYLLFTQGTDLMEQAFDLAKLELAGQPVVVAHRVLIGLSRGLARAAFSASQNGVLAYRTRIDTGYTELVWFDRQGKRLGSVGETADYSNPSLSPDETKLVVSRMDLQSRARDLWLFDVSSGASSRFTFDPADETNGVWSPDASTVAFNAVRNAAADIYLKPIAGNTQPKLLLSSSDNKQIESWSPDGRFLLYRIDARTWALPLGGGKPQGPYAMEYPAISPNGRWIAYTSDQSGRSEVYVQSFPPSEGQWQVSSGGGIEPQWQQDGKELYYISGDRLVAVDVKTDAPVFVAGASRSLFEVPLESTRRRSRYQVASNGRRFLINLPVESSSPITVAINSVSAQPTDSK
jgi:DNA-binding winged helix-turn-helix (wHTH) protein/Tol biopolymer transport system component